MTYAQKPQICYKESTGLPKLDTQNLINAAPLTFDSWKIIPRFVHKNYINIYFLSITLYKSLLIVDK